MTITRLAALPLLAIPLVCLTGCPKAPAPKQQAPIQQQPLTTGAEARLASLEQQVAALAQTAAQMPGATEIEDRRLTSQALGQAAAALQVIEGDRPGGAFRQQMRIVESSRTQLEQASANVAVEPATDSALRAVNGAIQAMAGRRFAGNEPVRQKAAALAGQIDQLDALRGPLHSLAVSQTVTKVQQAIAEMATVLKNEPRP